MKAFVNQFIQQKILSKYSENTLKIDQNCLGRFLLFLAEKGINSLTSVTIEDLENFRFFLLKEQSFAVNYAIMHLKTIKKFFEFLEQNGLIFLDPAEDLQSPKTVRKLPVVPDKKVIKSFLELPDVSKPLGQRNRAILELFYSTGIRRQEMLNLTVHCVDFRSKTLRVLNGKGRKERVVPIGRTASFWLKKYIITGRNQLFSRLKRKYKTEDISALWLTERSPKLTIPGLNDIFRKYRKIHEENQDFAQISPHSLRRACATHMLENGAHPMIIQEILGHSHIKTLIFYLKLAVEEIQQSHSKTLPGS